MKPGRKESVPLAQHEPMFETKNNAIKYQASDVSIVNEELGTDGCQKMSFIIKANRLFI